MITAVAFVLAAGTGAVARLAIGHRLNGEGHVPVGTLVVNVTGSFVLGLLAGLDAPAATILGTALLGAYTTLSSFARDVVALAEERRWWEAVAYLLGTCLLAVPAAWLGLVLAPGS